MAISVAELADQLCVDAGDVATIAGWLGEHGGELPDVIAGDIRLQLSPHGERTAPENLYWSGADMREW